MNIVAQGERLQVPVAATIGMFDGVHVGHRSVLAFLRSEAGRRGLSSAAITFRRHPQAVLHPDVDFPVLMTPEAKLEALAETGIDYAIVLDFDKQLSELSAREFIRLIRDTYGVRLLLVGYDHRFGHNRSDTFADYVGYGRELGVEVMQTPELDTPLGHVSSSVIRRLVAAGDVALAAQMLSRPYRLEGTVVGGFKNGRKLGYPTANIALADRSLLLPRNGVYAVRVHVGGTLYGGMLNVGVRPTFNGSGKVSVEVNIFEFDRDIYGSAIAVDFVAHVRDERRMGSLDELMAQLAADKMQIQEILKTTLI